ncbi:MAG: ATP-binding cassette domain-containing protein [Oscillospiraceae bacterium]
MQELIYSGYAFLKGSHGYSGLLWPIFFTGVYYLAFNGILTLLFGRIKRLQYFPERRGGHGHSGSRASGKALRRDARPAGRLVLAGQGQTLAILGSSGSGKTTLLRCLNALEQPDAGCIRVAGETLFDGGVRAAKRAADCRSGWCFRPLTFSAVHGARKRHAGRPPAGKAPSGLPRQPPRDPAAHRRRAVRLLGQVGLLAQQDRYPGQLSGGQQQRVAIARALALQPDVLCLAKRQRAGPGADGRGAARHPQPRRAAHDDDRCDARAAVRPRCVDQVIFWSAASWPSPARRTSCSSTQKTTARGSSSQLM